MPEARLRASRADPAVFHELILINYAFGLVAEVDNDAALGDPDHPSPHHFAFLKRRLLLLELIEDAAKVFAGRTCLLVTLALAGNSGG